jgi:hypothetical protein
MAMRQRRFGLKSRLPIEILSSAVGCAPFRNNGRRFSISLSFARWPCLSRRSTIAQPVWPGKVPRYAPVAAIEDDSNFDEIEDKALDQLA